MLNYKHSSGCKGFLWLEDWSVKLEIKYGLITNMCLARGLHGGGKTERGTEPPAP